MTYEDILLEEAEDLLHFDSSVLLEASSGRQGDSGHGNKMGFFGKIKNGQYSPSGSPKVKALVRSGVLKPYGFENVDITDEKKLRDVMASIKRRRDIEGAKALVVSVIEGAAALLFGGLSTVTANAAAKMSNDIQTYGTGFQSFTYGASNVFKIIGIISGALAIFTEVANAVDAVKATKAIGQVRQNIMDAYDKVTVKIMNTKPGTDQKSTEEYHAMLRYRDMLRDCQLKLGNFGGVGADTYVASMYS